MDLRVKTLEKQEEKLKVMMKENQEKFEKISATKEGNAAG